MIVLTFQCRKRFHPWAIASCALYYTSGDSYSSFSIPEGNGQMRKKLYVPRVEDKNSNMRMLKISAVKDLVANSMNILEPSLLDSDGNQCEDGMGF